MSESRNKAADIAQRITDNYFARFDEEASNEDKVALFANAFHLIAAELNKCAGSAETGGEKAAPVCFLCGHRENQHLKGGECMAAFPIGKCGCETFALECPECVPNPGKEHHKACPRGWAK